MRRTLVIIGCAALLAGCGSAKDAHRLHWDKPPLVQSPPRMPHDHVIVGTVRNGRSTALTIDARKVVVRDAAGHAVDADARFTAAFAHPLYGAFQRPAYDMPVELFRLGIVAYLAPGKRLPLYVAYRAPATAKGPFTAYFPGADPLPLG